jgi:cysteinyl-tRNA synthetase
MSKSLKNVYTHKDLKERGFDILAYRYLVLTAHYRDQLNFTWDSLTAAQNALRNVRSEIRAWEQPEEVVVQFWQKFLEAANNDLNLPQALAIMWELVKSDLPTANKAATLLKMDEVLGLGLSDYVAKPVNAPEEVQKLLEKREHARANKDFAASDELRDEIKKHGFEVLDTPDGQKLRELS